MSPQAASHPTLGDRMHQWVFEQSPIAMAVLDAPMRIIDCNEAMARLIGSPKEQIVGLRIDEMRDQLFRAAAQEALAGKVVTYESPYHATTSDVSSWTRATFAPIRATADGRVIAVMAIAGEHIPPVSGQTTERRGQKEQREGAQRMDALGQLAGGVAHDFNNLLTVIAGQAEFLRERLGRDDPLYSEVESIRQATASAAALTRQLLAYSRRETIRQRRLDLNGLVTETLAMLERLIGEDIELVTTLAPQLPAVFGDSLELQRVLVNLALNARDAMPDGGVLTIVTERATVGNDISGLPAGEYAALTVADSGHGMEESVRRRIFEPFFTTKPPGRGVGLGLSTVLEIAERSGGRIGVLSKPNRGTRVTIHLPSAPAVEMESGSPGAWGSR